MKNKTVAAWLAFVGGPLGLHRFYLHGLYDMLGWLAQEEGIRLEPSALAGMAGPLRVQADANVTHLVWTTGGGMVPEDEMAKYLAKGK